MDIAKMMEQVQQMQSKMQSTQSDLAQQEVEATAGGGKVTVRANCAGDVLSIKISPDVADPNDIEMLEDLILSGVRQAIEKGKSQAATELGKITSGLGLPPGLL
jgi:DNA-binding YbaB/EbfC family protein